MRLSRLGDSVSCVERRRFLALAVSIGWREGGQWQHPKIALSLNKSPFIISQKVPTLSLHPKERGSTAWF